MLVIRSEQMAAFNKSALRSFEDEMRVHLGEFSPLLAKFAGEAQLRKAIQFGIGQANRYGFSLGGSLRLYLELMLLFGSHFDTDPQYSWLRPYLVGFDGISARGRARLLHWHATVFMGKVYGKAGSHAIQAGERASWINGQALENVGRDLSAQGLGLLAQLHPQRWEYLDEASARKLLDQSIADAARYGLANPSGAPLLLCLKFVFGHRVTDDPLYPWVSAILQSGDLDSQGKVAQLLQKSQQFVAIMLKPVKEARS